MVPQDARAGVHQDMEGDVMKLPQLRYQMPKNISETVQLGSINFSAAVRDGDLTYSKNISAKDFPNITTRNARAKQEDYSEITALGSWEKLVAVRGTDLLYDGSVVGTVLPGEKQFVAVNRKLVIWPDQVYLNTEDLNIYPMGRLVTTRVECTRLGTLRWSIRLGTAEERGDGVYDDVMDHIEALGIVKFSNLNSSADYKPFRILSKDKTDASFVMQSMQGALEMYSFIRDDVTVYADVPAMDYICESENRLWGCSSADRTIYASALGEPESFYKYEGLSTDSYALGVGSEGPFTGCCKLGSSVLFFKENCVHKILGSYPAEYSMVTYEQEGLKAGCHKSLQVINGILYYMGLHGVYEYNGGTPVLISPNFGTRDFRDAVAGNDGDSYYLSVVDDGRAYLFVYETRYGLWVLEDQLRATDFARIGKDMYFLDIDGHVWLEDSGQSDSDIAWTVCFAPFYGAISKKNSKVSVQGRKSFFKLLIRLKLEEGSNISAFVSFDGSLWEEVGRVIGGAEDVVSMRIPVGRSDKFELKLEGKGPGRILGIHKEYSVGSDV